MKHLDKGDLFPSCSGCGADTVWVRPLEGTFFLESGFGKPILEIQTYVETYIESDTGMVSAIGTERGDVNVSWGRWVCPYTGKVLTKASDIDIDHIVPLSHAHGAGGAAWTREKKRAFANDPINLLPVDDATNQAKGDKDPVEWKPPRRAYWPKYARQWRAVKTKYGLTISAAEEPVLSAMENPR